MPNTNPAIDCPETLRQVDESGRKTDLVNLFVVPAMTIGQKGQTLTDLRAMDQEATLCRALTGHGVAGVTEDGKSLMDETLMRRVMETAKVLDLPVMDHAEDSGLVGGCMNEGEVSARLGLKGLPVEAEVRIVKRDLRLARETGARIHLQHISAEESVAAIREAKRDLPGLTAETAPHYFTLTEEAVSSLGADAKMNPPLRTKKDREAIREGLADGTLDIIATDHAPHTPAEKNAPLDTAPFGIVGLETAFSISYTELVKGGVLSLPRLIALMSGGPAAIIGLDRGRIAVGKIADLVLLDTDVRRRIDRETFLSKGRNTPFHGREVSGRVLMTIRNGKTTFEDAGG
jgi:dihydroorotase